MDPSQLPQGVPPQAAQALQQSGMSPENLTQLLAQLATMSPDEVSEALQQLGVDVDPNTIHAAAKNWVDEHAGALAGDSGGATADDAGGEQPSAAPDDSAGEPPSPAASGATTTGPEAEEEMAQMEGEAGDPDAAQEGSEAYAQASPQDAAQAQAPVQSGGMPMPMRGPAGNATAPTGRGSPMDELISAQMMQGAAGNPNAAVPSPGGRGGGRMSLGPAPSAIGENPNVRAMISNAYRSKVGMGPGGGSGSSKVGVPLGPRTGGDPGATSSPLTRIKSGKKIR